MEQTLSIIIFLLMFFMIIIDKIERHIVTLVSGGLVLFLVFGLCMKDLSAIKETLNLNSFIERSFLYGASSENSNGINWSTIIFILGMMIMVEGMNLSGFFRWLCLSLSKAVNYKATHLLIVFMFLSAFLSMFIDSITVVLFLSAITVELSNLLKFNPVPMILSEIFCANLGGAATMCGDPPNIIIGTSLGFTFFDFLSNTGIIVLISFILIVLYFYIITKKDLEKHDEIDKEKMPKAKDAIINKSYFVSSVLIFFLAVVLLITHAKTTLTVNCIGVIIAILIIINTFIFSKKNLKKIIKGIDYKTLLFFIGLFISVCGLEKTGILEEIAKMIGEVSGGNIRIMTFIILWLSAIASAFVDNIPFSATMVPVIQSLSVSQGIDIRTLAWTLSLGTDLGGNGTPIGASANVVGTSVAQKSGHAIGWGRYCKYCLPATILVLIISTIGINILYI